MEVLAGLENYPGSVLVDVGANLGVYSLAAAAAGGRVVAVDPVPANLALLAASLTGLPGGCCAAPQLGWALLPLNSTEERSDQKWNFRI